MTAYDEVIGSWVILDGVSQSFDPRRWALLLGGRLLTEDPDEEQLARAAREFDAGSPSEVPWYLEEHLERGAQCTFLRVRHQRERPGYCLCEALGDSLVLVLEPNGDRWAVGSTWPFTSSSDMPSRPAVFSTRVPHLRGGPLLRKSIHIREGSRVFLLTDGIGRFALQMHESGRAPEEWWPFLSGPVTAASFAAWVHLQKVERLLEDDDTTVLEVVIP